MLSLFARFYIGLIVALILSVTAAAIALGQLYRNATIQEHLWLTHSLNKVLQTQLLSLPKSAWPPVLKPSAAEHPYFIDVIPTQSMPETQRLQLASEGVAISLDVSAIDDQVSVFYPLQGTPGYALRFVLDSQLYSSYNNLLLGILLALLMGIAITVWLLTRPLVRHVHQLVNISQAIGAGRLDVRADDSAPAPLGLLARAINRMAQQLQQLRQEQEAMTSAVSHELRTPIANLRFALDMTRNIDQLDPLRRHIGDMDNDIDALDSLVDELLTYARLRHAVERSPTQTLRLRPLLGALTEKLQLLQPNLNIQLVCDDVQQVQGIERDIVRAVDNLLRNALRHAQHYIRIEVTTDAEHHVTISVEDDGPGIPPPERQRVLLPFTRLDSSRARTSGGFGLGLAIVLRIAQQHQGDLQISDSSLGGARVSLHLPR